MLSIMVKLYVFMLYLHSTYYIGKIRLCKKYDKMSCIKSRCQTLSHHVHCISKVYWKIVRKAIYITEHICIAFFADKKIERAKSPYTPVPHNVNSNECETCYLLYAYINNK